MVKKITNSLVIALLVIRLFTIPWPTDLAGIITLASVVIISVAAGIALSSLLTRGDKGET